MDMSTPRRAGLHVRERMARLRGEADRKRRTVAETLCAHVAREQRAATVNHGS